MSMSCAIDRRPTRPYSVEHLRSERFAELGAGRFAATASVPGGRSHLLVWNGVGRRPLRAVLTRGTSRERIALDVARRVGPGTLLHALVDGTIHDGDAVTIESGKPAIFSA